jgi:hypothetical protein
MQATEALIVATLAGGLSLACTVGASNAGQTGDQAAGQPSDAAASPSHADGAATNHTQPRPADDPLAAFRMPDDWTTWRVAGDLFANVEHSERGYSFGRMLVETTLPQGYPAPTPPDAIELKRYPSVRRAEISGSVDPRAGSFMGFFPLFNHIQRNDIPMTAPVEMDFHTVSGEGEPIDNAGEPDWTMSFLYEHTDMGPTGADPRDDRVRVVDTEPVTVIAIGLRGWTGVEQLYGSLDELNAWLATQDEWRIAGNPRSFGYNGPSTPQSLRWAEVQIPIERTAESNADDSEQPANPQNTTGDV